VITSVPSERKTYRVPRATADDSDTLQTRFTKVGLAVEIGAGPSSDRVQEAAIAARKRNHPLSLLRRLSIMECYGCPPSPSKCQPSIYRALPAGAPGLTAPGFGRQVPLRLRASGAIRQASGDAKKLTEPDWELPEPPGKLPMADGSLQSAKGSVRSDPVSLRRPQEAPRAALGAYRVTR
jgi:hypothetical protein